jgi:adenine-specific DNA methylase
MSEPKKLIEVAMPIKEISAESVRDKSIRSGHISTLHLWWARRPLPVCRAIIFASLVPDPLDVNCPIQFKEAVVDLLGAQNNLGDPYKPYEDIPFTSSIDRMEDNLRNRLMMFIGKFSNKFIINEKTGKSTDSKDQISEKSLIKWEAKDNELVIGKAKKLIWVSYNSKNGLNYKELSNEYDLSISKIHEKSTELYNIINRHIKSDEVNKIENELQEIIDCYLNKMPMVFDPFAGGGAIPLEASRLGCRSYGNDINPVAHIVQKSSLIYPQKFNKKIVYSNEEYKNLYGQIKKEESTFNFSNSRIEVSNRLSFDVKKYCDNLIERVKKNTEHLFLGDKDNNKPIVYYWVHVANCDNPTCLAKVPLLKQFYLSKRRSAKEKDWIYLCPIINQNQIKLEVKKGVYEEEGWMERGNLKCPCCGNITQAKKLKEQFIAKKTSEIIVATIFDVNGKKEFRTPDTSIEYKFLKDIPSDLPIPNELMPVTYTQALPSCTWGLERWGDMFSKRQQYIMLEFVEQLKFIETELNEKFETEYVEAVITYLALFIDRIAMRYTKFNTWHLQQDTIEKIMGRQSISMVFDYPEMNPFGDFTSAAKSQIDQIINYINEEGKNFNYSICNHASSGDKAQFSEKQITAVITDPPYYDAIAYADLSDFFYVWLKRSLGNILPYNFTTPQTPKTEECTALKHHHRGNIESAKKHFEDKLTSIFDAIEYQTSDIVSIMFAHQSTEAWTTLCNSILNARMNITGSWAVDTESTSGLKDGKAFLSSSVTVSAKPVNREGVGNFKEVKLAIENKVENEVDQLYKLGFRGADLLTACFGQAVSEFGKYTKVEKADGSLVKIPELLELARESAFNTLLKGFSGDEYTKFYIGWLQLNGLLDTEFDDAAKFTKVGLTINVQDLFKEHVLIKKNNKQHLGSLRERLNENSKIGEGRNNSIIDQTHKLMHLYSSPNRNNLLKYIELNSYEAQSPVWRVLTSLAELLPKDIEDHKLAIGLLTNKDQLIREAKTSNTPKAEQSQLTFE